MSEAADAVGRLLSLIVHDLRNPAATIKANVEFMQSAGATSSDPDVVGALGDTD